ncbi:MAG: hypothetical protein IVW54_15340 [Candidatus Binataceae bacterium]|nr:hypothetical protein [Candidatus Binataceae bacterium]
MNERIERLGAVATRLLFENGDVKVWEMDVPSGARFPHHHHSLEYLFYVIAPAILTVSRHGVDPYEVDARERALYFYPGDKSETFLNNGPGPYREVLVELKRMPRADQKPLSFMKCEALIGQKPKPGIIRIVENDRITVSETMIKAETEAIVAHPRDAVTYVIEGARMGIAEHHNGARGSHAGVSDREEERPAGGVYWEPAGTSRKLRNLGPAAYRQLTVELK